MKENKMANLVGVYPAHKGKFIGVAVCGAVTILLGLLILWAAWEVATGSISYSGDGNPLVLLGSIGGGIFLLGAVFVYVSFMHRPKYSFMLYEDSIVVKQKKATNVRLLFTEIEDVLYFGVGFTSDEGFRTTHLAFRKNPASEWFVISPGIVDHYALMNQFSALHTEQRGGFIFEQWEKTSSPVEIRYVEPTFAKNELSLAAYLKLYTTFKTLQLAKNHLKIDGKRIDFDHDYTLQEGEWTSKIYLKDSKGEEKFSINYADVLSVDVFFALLSSQLNNTEDTE
jgi:hypothetical protein